MIAVLLNWTEAGMQDIGVVKGKDGSPMLFSSETEAIIYAEEEGLKGQYVAVTTLY